MEVNFSLILGAWGAFLSTILAVRTVLKDRPSLKFCYEFEKDEKNIDIYLVLTATNDSNKLIVIKKSHYLLGKSKVERKIFNDKVKIKPQDSHNFKISLKDKLDYSGEFDEDFFKNVYDFFFITSSGKTIKYSLPMSIDDLLRIESLKENLPEISYSFERLNKICEKVTDKGN